MRYVGLRIQIMKASAAVYQTESLFSICSEGTGVSDTGDGDGSSCEAGSGYCIRNGMLAEILSANRAEVLNLILTEYDEQSHIASEKEISYAEGIEKGINQSEERQSMLFKKMKADGRIADYFKGMEDRDYLHTLYEEFDLM